MSRAIFPVNTLGTFQSHPAWRLDDAHQRQISLEILNELSNNSCSNPTEKPSTQKRCIDDLKTVVFPFEK